MKSTRIYPNAIKIVGTQPSVAAIITAPPCLEARNFNTPSTSQVGLAKADSSAAARETETAQPRDTGEHAPQPAVMLTNAGPTERPPPKHRLFMHGIRTRREERAQLRESLGGKPPAVSLSNPPLDSVSSEVANAWSSSTGTERSSHPIVFNSCLDDVVGVAVRGMTQTLVYKPSPRRGRRHAKPEKTYREASSSDDFESDNMEPSFVNPPDPPVGRVSEPPSPARNFVSPGVQKDNESAWQSQTSPGLGTRYKTHDMNMFEPAYKSYAESSAEVHTKWKGKQ